MNASGLPTTCKEVHTPTNCTHSSFDKTTRHGVYLGIYYLSTMTSDATAKASAAAAADGKKSSSSSSFSARSFLLSAVLAFCATRLYQKVTVYQQPFNKADFAHGKYNIKEIPVTYYHVDRIAEVLPEVRSQAIDIYVHI